MVEAYVVGVDVGTGSVRAALITLQGAVVRTSTHEIRTWNPLPDFFQQSTPDIWNAVCITIKDVISKIDRNSVKGIGFCATCSLAVFDKNLRPLSVSPGGEQDQNVMLWMDHRAFKQANFINESHHPLLKYFGNKISLELAVPKLLWLKENMHEKCWSKAGYFFDLSDFLTFKATNAFSRSLSGAVYKWTSEISSPNNMMWNLDYFKQMGLEDLAKNNWEKIGSLILEPGAACGMGLTKEVSQALGLIEGTPVGTSIVDAHAGGLGLIGSKVKDIPVELHTRLNLIGGSSSCHMCVNDKALYVPGVWGPYNSAMVPGMFLNIGGQSVSGKLIDFIIANHPTYLSIRKKLSSDQTVYNYLHNILLSIMKKNKKKSVDELTCNIHMWPDFHGNRSPLADPSLRGMITGVSLSNNEEDLAVLYLATLQALAYGTRHIIETLVAAGYSKMSCVLISGGLSKNTLFLETQSNALSLPVICPDEQESVLLGTGMLGACAAKIYRNVLDAIKHMSGSAHVTQPNNNIRKFHDKKYAVFLKMVEHQKEYKKIMEESL